MKEEAAKTGSTTSVEEVSRPAPKKKSSPKSKPVSIQRKSRRTISLDEKKKMIQRIDSGKYSETKTAFIKSLGFAPTQISAWRKQLGMGAGGKKTKLRGNSISLDQGNKEIINTLRDQVKALQKRIDQLNNTIEILSQ